MLRLRERITGAVFVCVKSTLALGRRRLAEGELRVVTHIYGSVFCDCEEVRLGERSLSCEGNALFCHSGGCGTVDTGVGESLGGGVERSRLEDWQFSSIQPHPLGQ